MKMTVTGELNGRTETERAKLIKQDWESKGYKVTMRRQYNAKTNVRNTMLYITKSSN